MKSPAGRTRTYFVGTGSLGLRAAGRLLGALVLVLSIGCAGPAEEATSPTPAQAEEAPAQVVDLAVLSRRAQEAKAAEDWAAARDVYLEALEIAGRHPAIHQRLAEVTLRLGDPDAAVGHLADLARLGGTTALGEDTPFADLAGHEGFAAVADRIEANGAPFPAAEVFVTFEDRKLYPEGIAWDAETGDLFTGSFSHNKIVRISPDGTIADFGTSATDDLGGVLGMWVDTPRRELWAVAGSTSMEEMNHRAELVRYQVDTGRLVARYPAPELEETILVNDVVVTPDGTAWVTEGLLGGLYRVPPDGEELELFLPLTGLGFANGIAAAGDGFTIYVAHAEGLSAIDPTTGAIERVVPEGDFTLVSADGLSWADGDLVLVQNHPSLNNRVTRVTLDPTGRRALSLEILDAGLPEGLIPYTSAYGDNRVFLIASPIFDLKAPEDSPPPSAILTIAQ